MTDPATLAGRRAQRRLDRSRRESDATTALGGCLALLVLAIVLAVLVPVGIALWRWAL